MILRSIQVQGWKCFADGVRVGPLCDGLNLIYGPNGAGKSTLLWAALRALFDNHKVGGEGAKDELRPWGRDLNPLVRVEFEHGGQGYEIQKQFLKEHFSKLGERNGTKYTPLAEGESATDRVREMLLATPPSSGLTQATHWGLAQVLWAPQGQLSLNGLAGTTLERIRTSLGAQVAGPGTQPILDRIELAYGKIYTGTGKFKTGASAPPVTKLVEQAEQVRKDVAKLTADVEAFETASRRIEELKAVSEQAGGREKSLTEALAKARERDREYQKLVSQRDVQASAAKAAEAQHAAMQTRLANLKQTRDSLAELRGKLLQLTPAVPLEAQQVERCRGEAEQARLVLQSLKQARPKLDEADARKDRATAFLNLQSRLAALEDLLTKLTAAEMELSASRDKRNALVAPDRAAIKKIRTALAERDDARRNLDASLITLTITPEQALHAEALAAEQPGPLSLVVGEATQLKGSPEVVVRIAGLGTVRATGPQGNVEQWQTSLKSAQQKLEQLTTPFGSQDAERLQQLSDQAEELAALVHRQQASVDALRGGKTAEALAQERATLAAQRDAIIEREPEWVNAPPDVDALADAARAARHEHQLAEDKANSTSQAAESALQTATARQQATAKEVKTLEGNVTQGEKRLAELEADGLDDTGRAQQLQQFARAMLLAQTALDQATETLQGFGGDPHAEVVDLDAQLTTLRAETAKKASEFNRLQGELKGKAAQGSYSALAQAEDQLAGLVDEINRQNLYNSAIKLLADTIDDCRRAAVETLVKPVEVKATATLQRIAGPRFCEVRFDDNFKTGGVAPKLASGPVDLVRLSGGEQEQVHLAVRLALAEVLAGDDRHLLVLDDALVNTDPGRMGRIRTILKEAAQRFQVLILSCHPDLYTSIVDEPYRFNLEELAAEELRP